MEPWMKRAFKGVKVVVHPHQGKGQLPIDLEAPAPANQRGVLDQLPAKLRGFSSLGDAVLGVLVLLDADNDDCRALNNSVTVAARTVAPNLRVEVRVAVEETEAFYLGDIRAIRKAYPSADIKRAKRYQPDSICGTWEEFGKVIDDPGENKVTWATAMGPVVTTKPERSKSPSFKSLHRALRRLATVPPVKKRKKKPYRHVARTARK